MFSDLDALKYPKITDYRSSVVFPFFVYSAGGSGSCKFEETTFWLLGFIFTVYGTYSYVIDN